MIETHGKRYHQLAMVVVEGGDVFAESRTMEQMEEETRRWRVFLREKLKLGKEDLKRKKLKKKTENRMERGSGIEKVFNRWGF